MDTQQSQLVRNARITGVWYLCLAFTGIIGFLVLHPHVFVSNDASKTLANLVENTSLARIRLILELGIVISQALTAVWFYKIFRKINEVSAWSIGIWGMINATVIMISAIAMGMSIDLSSASDIAQEHKIAMIRLLELVITNAWGVGGVFFGLWLIPMGYTVVSSNRMPLWLGRLLMIGGAGYLVSTFLKYLGFSGDMADLVVIPATVAEFWMIGYLLVYGIRTSSDRSDISTEKTFSM